MSEYRSRVAAARDIVEMLFSPATWAARRGAELGKKAVEERAKRSASDEPRSYVKCVAAEATHVLVLKDIDPAFVGKVYPIIKCDWNDVIVDLGDGKRRIVYEDEHEWRKRSPA